MRIDSVGVKVPSRKVTNADILQMLEEHSNGVSPVLLKTYQRMVRGLFKMAGSEVRYTRDETKNEKASDFHHWRDERSPGKGRPGSRGISTC